MPLLMNVARGEATTGRPKFSSHEEEWRAYLNGTHPDIRLSSDLARRVGTMEFTRLMQPFYVTATDALLADNAIIDKFVGDEVVGFFLPLLTGPNHAAAAVRAAEHLLLETGHGEDGGPWLPLGAGVHTGVAFVGMVSRGPSSDFTAFGDPINIAAHVAAQAAPGEILITDASAAAAGLATDGVTRRHLSLKGHPVDVVVQTVPSPHPLFASS